MEILSHALWTGLATKTVQQKTKGISFWNTVFWGVFPDIIPFVPLFGWILIKNPGFAWIRSYFSAQSLGEEHILGVPFLDFSYGVYHMTHSLIVWIVLFILAYAIARRPVFELCGWLLHILIDIPTHTGSFYPTEFLWPLSSLHINGIAWITPLFIGSNYILLAIGYCILFMYRKKKHATV